VAHEVLCQKAGKARWTDMPTKARSAARARNRSEPPAGANHPPAWIKPQLAALVKEAPDVPDWLHELKLDGYRMHARLDAGRVNIFTRRGNDWTEKYPTIAEAIAALPAQDAYLDGELCGVLPDGRTAFNLIQNASVTRGRANVRAGHFATPQNP
jgi:ATP-dependent DNA ligase